MSDHQHRLQRCHDCDGNGLRESTGDVCEDCGGRGYREWCEVCGEPMGNARRRWKREQGGDNGGAGMSECDWRRRWPPEGVRKCDRPAVVVRDGYAGTSNVRFCAEHDPMTREAT